MARRLAYLGTPAFAVPVLEALVAEDHDVALVVSQPDRRRGRGGRTTPSPVKAAAQDLGLAVTDRVDDVLEVGADLGVVVAFGRLIKPHVLDALPMVNLHFSRLPRWRGAAPVERAILAGDRTTGVDLMVVAEGLDTGAIYDRAELSIGPDETADELRERLSLAGTELVVRNLAQGLGTPRAQEGEPCYAHKIDPAELKIDWSRSPGEVHRLVRIGGAWTTYRGKRLKIWRTALHDGASGDAVETEGAAVPAGAGMIRLLEVQPEGKARMAAEDWANGVRWDGSEMLGD
jgi:methionyl-tRNA formyltransferase